MLKKRLIGVITVRQGRAVQSFGYRSWLPLGRPEVLAQNLDRWGVDEILLQCIDRVGCGPDFELLLRLGKAGLSTPLIYSGGIASVQDAAKAIQLAADRICVDALLQDSWETVERISEHLGQQALIGVVPLSVGDVGLMWYDYRTRKERPFAQDTLRAFQADVVSEVLVADWRNEGRVDGFDMRLISQFPVPGLPLIPFGGLSNYAHIGSLLKMPAVSAVAIGNFLSYSEHAVQRYREHLGGTMLRPAVYQSSKNP